MFFHHPPVSPEQRTRMRYHHHAPFLRFLLHSAFSVRLSGHFEAHEEQPLSEPVGIHSAMNAAEPVSPSIATMKTLAPAPAPESSTRVQHDRPSTSLWQLYNYYHRIFHSLQCCYTSHLHTRNCHLCTSHTAPRGRLLCRGH